MPSPTDEKGSSLERYRSYLQMLARIHLPPRLQAKLGESDVIQETLLRAHANWETVQDKSEGERKAWLRSILTNHLIDVARYHDADKRAIDRERSLEASLRESSVRLEHFLVVDQSSPGQHLEREELFQQLADALAVLPQTQRDAVILKHVHGLSVAEICLEMDQTRDAVGGLLARGLKKLRQLLEQARGP